MTTNASDLSLQPINDAALFLLPTRGEKRIIPVVTPSIGSDVTGSNLSITPADFLQTAALEQYYEFVSVRIPGRGVTANGDPDPHSSAVFHFLVNPAQVQVTRQQVDAQTMARSGWQIGLWGEDLVRVSLEGKTPGKYFSNGLTDMQTEYTASYRNLVALELMVENNGYWFEGEQAGEGPLAADYTRRQIKVHSDVILTKGEFIWYGMFESMDITEDATTPHLVMFNLAFVAWREHFRSETPYSNPIGGAVDFGHVPGISQGYSKSNNPDAVGRMLTVVQPQLTGAIASIPAQALPNLPANSAALAAANSGAPMPNLPAIDTTPTSPIMNPSLAQFG